MRLKSLKICGFKSFADRTVLDFDASIIGIVGPNGCGKSNIVDAFRWVLGEPSAKSLRGTQMQDVLFAGSMQRKAAQLAEVSVTLDQIQEHELSLPYRELTITRKLYSDGQSEYLINRQSVRLKDIQHLLLGTGLGVGAFSIFEQGKIDRIISLSPTMRREIFDEAAGIGRFLERKKETLRKLSSMMENYHRINDLHAEVDKQTKLLKRQAQAAERYLEQKKNLEQHQKQLLVCQFKALYQQQVEEKEKAALIEKQRELETATWDQLQQHITTIKQQLAVDDNTVSALQERLTQATKELALHEAKQQQQIQKIKELTAKQKNMQEQTAQLENEIIHLQKQLNEKSSLIKDNPKELETQVKDLQKRYLESVHEQAQLQQRTQVKHFELQRLEEKEKRNKEEKAQLEHQTIVLENTMQTQQDSVETIKQEVEASLKQLRQVEKQLHDLQQQKQEAEKAEKEFIQSLTQLVTEKKMLQALKASQEGLSETTRHLLSATCDPQHELYGMVTPLTEHLEPHANQAHLLDTALLAYRQTLITETEKQFKAVLEYARKHQLKDLSLFCLQEASHATEKVSFAKQSKVAAHFLKHFLVKDDQLQDEKKVVFICSQSLDAPFLQQQRLEQIEKELSHLTKAISKLALPALIEQLEQSKQIRAQLDEKQRKQEMILVKENFSLQQLQIQLKEKKARLKHVQQASESDQIQPVQEQCIQIQGLLENHTQQVQALQQQWQQAQELLQSSTKHMHQMQLIETTLNAKSQHILQLKEECEQIHQTLTLLHQPQNQHDQQEAEALCRSLKVSLAEAKDTLSAARVEQEKQTKLLHASHEIVHRLEKQQATSTMRLQQLQEQSTNTLSQLQEHFSLSEQEVLTSEAALNQAEIEHQIKTIRRYLEEEKTVNLTAIETYAEQVARFEELDHQLKDLIAAKEDLEALIAKLDHESRKLFKQTFGQIQENFQRNFVTLFGAGEADLRFTDSQDVLEAGIEIIAKPPGKQMRSISLLSGGEKCLTALALLFSIFEVKPAPFCILDEVDAPLDESNVGRFTQLLSRFIDKTQFLIVTHNKKTMSVADVLMGVSMEEKGVSKLLLLTLTKQEALV